MSRRRRICISSSDDDDDDDGIDGNNGGGHHPQPLPIPMDEGEAYDVAVVDKEEAFLVEDHAQEDNMTWRNEDDGIELLDTPPMAASSHPSLFRTPLPNPNPHPNPNPFAPPNPHPRHNSNPYPNPNPNPNPNRNPSPNPNPSCPGVPPDFLPLQTLLHERGAQPKPQWFSSCLDSLLSMHPNFRQFPVVKQAELCFANFLFADLNLHGSALLPPNFAALHAVELAGPFVLQVDEITNICSSVRDQYTEKPAMQRGRCLKLSITDGVQRVFGIEYRPIKDLKVLLPAGLKIALGNVHVCRGLLLLVPEVVTVLGGCVEQLEAAKQRLLLQLRKPPRGQRNFGGAEKSFKQRATDAAWPASLQSDTLHADSATDSGHGGGRSRTQELPPVPFTYLSLLMEKWSLTYVDGTLMRGKIKCILTGVKEFLFKHQDQFKLTVFIDDGSLITTVLIAHQVVERFIGHSPKQVTAALMSSDQVELARMKDVLRQFQSFLTKFEGFMVLERDKNGNSPLVVEMKEGVTNSDAWLLLHRLQENM